MHYFIFCCVTQTTGTRSAMMNKLECLERSARATRRDENKPESVSELGRGMHEKRAKMYTDSESAEDNQVFFSSYN